MTSFQVFYSLASVGSVLSLVALALGDIEQAKILSVSSFWLSIVTFVAEKALGGDDEPWQ